MRRAASAVTLVLVAALAACTKGESAAPPPAHAGPRAYRVTAVDVTPRPLTYSVEAIGSLEAYQVVTVPARVEGTLERLAFDEGTTVTPDTVLAVIDERRYTLRVEQAAAALREAEAAAEEAAASSTKSAAQTARVRAELDEATSSLARWKALREKNPGWVTEEKIAGEEMRSKSLAAQADEAAAGEGQAAANVRQSAAAIEARRAALSLAEKDVADASVRSPIGGVVEAKHVSAGQYVKVGDKIATLVDTHVLRLRFSVSEAESVRLKKGQPVTFRVAAFPERTFRADLFHVDATADGATRMVECLAQVADPDPALRPGFFATIHVEISREGDAIVVPEGALLATEEGFVAFVVGGGRAEKRQLALGLHTQDGGVEVLSGLAAGEKIALKGAQSLRDGVPVEIVTEAGQ